MITTIKRIVEVAIDADAGIYMHLDLVQRCKGEVLILKIWKKGYPGLTLRSVEIPCEVDDDEILAYPKYKETFELGYADIGNVSAYDSNGWLTIKVKAKRITQEISCGIRCTIPF